jgi:DNA-binding LacI/PurR family transcriptional regulator
MAYRRATSYDVAKAAGVAQSTVSRSFQPDSGISSETRQRVFKAAADLGFSTNALARSLITQRSNMIGVIATRFTIRNNPDLVYELGSALQAAGNQLLLMVIEQDDAIGATLQQALEYPLDGLICCAVMSSNDMAHFRKRAVPVVFFNREVTFDGADTIATDHVGAGHQIADALFAAGHRRMICVQGPETAPVSQIRADAFVGRLETLGAPKVARCWTDFSYADGRRVFFELMKSQSAPEAVFCANDQLALGVMDACRYDLGLRVPNDVSIVGFDDIAEASRPSYDLTTIRQPILEMAHQAIALLAERMENPDLATRSIRRPGQFMLRKSARI